MTQTVGLTNLYVLGTAKPLLPSLLPLSTNMSKASKPVKIVNTIINTVIKKILPWHPVEFLDVGSISVELSISNVLMRAQLNKNGVPFLVLTSENVSEQDEYLVEHLNGILSGMTRNDAGELVAKES